MKNNNEGTTSVSTKARTRQIMLALVLGIFTGMVCNYAVPEIAQAKNIASYFAIVSDVFLHMIKMIIAPLVFATIVTGIAAMGHSGGAVRRVACRALGWFVLASLMSLGIGMIFSNLLIPGTGLGLPLPSVAETTNLATGAFNLKDFIGHIVPTSVVQALASNEILQIVVFSIFLSSALGALGNTGAQSLMVVVGELVPVMLKVTDYVMRFAPLGVFAAIASVVTVQGIGILITYSKFVGTFYLASAALWVLLILIGRLILGSSVFRLTKSLQEPMAIAFSTASSEAAFPAMFEQLRRYGVSERIAAFVLPLGYSFNLAGSMIYQAVATLFVAQAYDIQLSLSSQLSMLLLMMVTSKGVAGVPRASLVVVAATLPLFGLPASGMLLILGIDQFLDMGRALTNVLSNGIATAVVAKWEDELEVTQSDMLKQSERAS